MAMSEQSACMEPLNSFSPALQERLERQQHETEIERARLQGLVSKLELQLTEQARILEEVSLLLLLPEALDESCFCLIHFILYSQYICENQVSDSEYCTYLRINGM